MIKYNNQPCLEIKDLWQALYSTFNKVQNQQIDVSQLNKLSSKHSSVWLPFSDVEFINAISKCNNSSISSPNKLLWRHLKTIVNDSRCLKNFVNIADACFELGYWPSYFKTSTSIIISKLNKESYNSPKSFRHIILLNTISKLIEKVIGKRLQFHLISNNFIYLSQLGRPKQHLMIDAKVTLMYFIHSG